MALARTRIRSLHFFIEASRKKPTPRVNSKAIAMDFLRHPSEISDGLGKRSDEADVLAA